MSDPLTFTTTTPRFGLPNLFVGQSQKEFFVNEALARLDAIVHTAIEGELSAPPTTHADGQTWLVGDAPTGEWSGHDGELASLQGGIWTFVLPARGMRVSDLSTGGSLYFDGAWNRVMVPNIAAGGSVVDSEARQAIGDIIATLQNAGIFPTQ